MIKTSRAEASRMLEDEESRREDRRCAENA